MLRHHTSRRLRNGTAETPNFWPIALTLAALCCVMLPLPAGAQLFGSPQVITAAATSGRQIATADLDKDGDLDVLGASYLGDGLSWYENDGTPGGLGDWLRRSLGAANLPNSVFPADIDKDGVLDVLAANSNSIPFNNIVWMKGDGTPLDGGWTGNVISNPGIGRRAIAADIDNDGDLDVVGGSANAELLAWYVNDGTPGGLGDWTANVLTTTADIYTVVAADMDGDGDLDILADTNGISWWANDGTPGGLGDWVSHSVDATVGASAAVVATDIDGDGDLDVLAAAFGDNKVEWYANNGSGVFGAAQVISNTATNAGCAVAADLDGDGDRDVLACSAAAGAAVAWYENDGTPGGLGDWTQHVVDAVATGATWVHTADLDGDHDPDALAMLYSNELVWYANLHLSPAAVLPETPGLELAIQSVRARAGGDGLVVTFTLPASGRSRVELFDVSGRRQQAIEMNGLQAGTHTIDVTRGGSLASGMYWLRLVQGDRSVSARAAIAR